MKTLKFTTTLPRCLIFLVGPGAAPMTSTADKAHLTGKNRDGSGPGQKSATPAATRKRHSANGLVWVRRFLLLGGVIGSGSAPALIVDTVDEAKMVDQGFKVFTQETFGGNGRTCGTCHIPENHYNVGPEDIKAMRKGSLQRELIFLGRTVPGFENATLVEKRALFNIGPDAGFGFTPTGPFRATMTIGGLEKTSNDTTIQRRRFPQGWAGEGSPDKNDPIHAAFPETKFDGTLCRSQADG